MSTNHNSPKGNIFLLNSDSTLLEMQEAPYDSEDLLQRLLDDHPALLAGDQMSGGDARRWILVKREAGVPAEEGGGDHWSLDHLFLDQDGVPTLVEVKRSSDTRIRREVVGQMLDYAANAVVHWSLDKVKSDFEATCKSRGQDADEVLSNHVYSDADSEKYWEDPASYWEKVKTNLEAGKVRLIFAADHIPARLRRIVEFLNEQMDPAEVLALEVKQFVGRGMKTLVPRVIGQTAAAQTRKSTPVGRKWDNESVLAEFAKNGFVEEAHSVGLVLDWIEARGGYVRYGSGAQTGSAGVVYPARGTDHVLCVFRTDGKVGLRFNRLKEHPPFDGEEQRLQLRDRYNEIPGLDIPPNRVDRNFDTNASLIRGENVQLLINALEFAVMEIELHTQK